MGSDKYFFLLLAFFFSNALGDHEEASHNTTLKDAEEQAGELAPSSDTISSLLEAKEYKEGYGKDWIGMPDGDGIPIEARMDVDETEYAHSRSLLTDESAFSFIKLFLFNGDHPEGKALNLLKLHDSGIDPSRTFKIICHGWMSSTNSSIVKVIKNAYLKKNKYNIIGVDWHFFSKNIYYPTAAKLTRIVGKFIGFAIDTFVKKFKVKYEDFHVIGHSLGAHVAGFAGSSTGKKIARITGLDPALPSFEFVKGHDGRLDSSDAKFVDVIHTCAGVLGMTIPAGHVDFYPNGGTPFQPGCQKSLNPLETQACSHLRSFEYFAESIDDPHGFEAVKCLDWFHFRKHLCKKEFAVMGDAVSKEAHGIFYLMTNKFSPYAKGSEGLKV